MRTASAPMIALLNNSTEYFMADLLTIVPVVGSAVRLTSSQQDITIASRYPNVGSPANQTFLSAGPTFANPRFKRGDTKLQVGTSVDASSVTIYADPVAHTFGGVPWPAAAIAGAFEGAAVILEKMVTATWGDYSAGTFVLFWGHVGKVTPTRGAVMFELLADLQYLTQQLFPRNLYAPGCLHTLFDAGCTLAAGTYAVSGSVSGAATTSGFNTSLTNADGYFSQGRIVFTSGALNGKVFGVKSSLNASGAVALLRPASVAPAVSDTFTIYPGCDKTQATCTSKFSNLAHFRGFPYVPTPENAR